MHIIIYLWGRRVQVLIFGQKSLHVSSKFQFFLLSQPVRPYELYVFEVGESKRKTQFIFEFRYDLKKPIS